MKIEEYFNKLHYEEYNGWDNPPNHVTIDYVSHGDYRIEYDGAGVFLDVGLHSVLSHLKSSSIEIYNDVKEKFPEEFI